MQNLLKQVTAFSILSAVALATTLPVRAAEQTAQPSALPGIAAERSTDIQAEKQVKADDKQAVEKTDIKATESTKTQTLGKETNPAPSDKDDATKLKSERSDMKRNELSANTMGQSTTTGSHSQTMQSGQHSGATTQHSRMSSQTGTQTGENSNVLQTISESGNFTILNRALKEAGLDSTLKTSRNLTLFAPTDEAFNSLPPGTLDNLLKPENKAELKRILSYHVIGSKKVTSQELQSDKTLKTLEGKNLNISRQGSELRVNNANVAQSDIQAKNGVIHTIDQVLMP
jgi:uncharacterized surface protein with fasciclin (FAS1) repeats